MEKLLFLLGISLILWPLFESHADGEGVSNGTRTITTRSQEDQLPPQLDKRLPPVLPGQEVTINGKRMRVFSTSGPVAVSPPPQAPAPGESGNKVQLDDVDVIVDLRDSEKGHGHHPRE